jgi:hypothetical protein
MAKAAAAITADLAARPIAATVVAAVDRHAAAADIAAAAKCRMVEEHVPAPDMQQFRAVTAVADRLVAAVGGRPVAAAADRAAAVVVGKLMAVAAAVADTTSLVPLNK